MGSDFDVTKYLADLPRRKIRLLPSGSLIPKLKVSGKLADYNGFTAVERLRTFEISKWLMSAGAMVHSGRCSICGGTADQQHAEDYYELRTWMDICRGCHSSLHGRYRTPAAWGRRLESYNLTADHWARRLPDERIDVAAFHRSNGRREPRPEDFIEVHVND